MNIINILIILSGFYLLNGSAYIAKFGTEVRANIAEIWPKPKHQRRCINILIDPNNFEFVVAGETCDILNEALIRYTKIIKQSVEIKIFDIEDDPFEVIDTISKIVVNLTSPCEYLPYLEMDESYQILGADNISANSIWGILRALETYSQVLIPLPNGMLQMPNIKVIDSPRFPHRGLLLDTARHYIKIDIILTILDGMAYNKLNVFHWHIVDDQSFPYQSKKFPELSEKGAYFPTMIYTRENITNIIEYARMRGIRVVAEFSIPSHTRSWGISHPEILTRCEWMFAGKLGPINPVRIRTYDFLENFLSEVLEVFQDKFIHIGGNEVEMECWNSNEVITAYISANELSTEYLYNYFMNSMIKTLLRTSISSIVWDEALSDNYGLPNETIIQVQAKNWKKYLSFSTYLGHRVVLSHCWELNKLSPNSEKDWIIDYNCEPYDFDGTLKQKQLIIGGEAIIWTHTIGNNNIIQNIFPRISAMAERLWSKAIIRNITDAIERLEQHTCRMVLRGIPIESPSGLEIC